MAVDWERVELDYRAGVMSLREIASVASISEGAIRKRAKRDGWSRDLSAKVASRADDLVRKSEVRSEVRSAQAISEKETVEASAQAIANAIISHRKDIARNRGLANKLLTELEAQVDSPEEFEKLGEMMYSPDDKGMDKLNDLYKKVTSLPSRIDSAKKLGETLKVLIALEREAYGVDKEVKPDTGLTGESISTLKKLKAALENAD
ncbi:MAG: hypothetical protein BWY57_03112 [Betaproteobacteria bacterium ADurb.Bin341]|nr:MAG: hypothetical protein BWY57_03112 [Betaproteobacteria bacterium ADurb.Bin341]